MTANELASQVEAWEYEIGAVFSKKVATMLRQQAKEIAMLKQIIDANNLQSDIGQFVKPIDEPVAWIDSETRCFVYSQYDYEDLDEYGKDGLIPLYTHPMRELSDEEIGQFKGQWYRGDFNSFYDLVQAILKKASEK